LLLSQLHPLAHQSVQCHEAGVKLGELPCEDTFEGA
jgi:hypothetical protein